MLEISALIVAVAGLLLPLVLSYFQRERKNLSFRKQYSGPLLPFGKQRWRDLVILADGKEVDNVYIAILDIVNSGTKPIRAQDYEHAVSIVPSRTERLLGAEVLDTNPDDLKVELVPRDDVVEIKPLLLNRDDRISVALLSEGKLEKIALRGRIAGIEKIGSYRPERRWRAVSFTGLLMGIAATVGFYVAVPDELLYQEIKIGWPYYVLLVAAVITFFIGNRLAQKELRKQVHEG